MFSQDLNSLTAVEHTKIINISCVLVCAHTRCWVMATGLATFLNKLDADVVSALAEILDIALDPSAKSKSKALNTILEKGADDQVAFVSRLRKRVQKVIRADCIQHVYAALEQHPGNEPPVLKNSASRVTWIYLKTPEVFAEAEHLMEHARWQGKEDYWTGFILDEEFDLPETFEVKRVYESLREIFQKRDGGGAEIIIRGFERPSTVAKQRAHHLTIYRSSLPETIDTIANGMIEAQEYVPCSSVNVMIDKPAGLFELTAEAGGKKFRQSIATVLLAEMKLDPADLRPASPRKVDLSALRERQLFPASAHDGIIGAKLVELGFYDADEAFVRVKLRDSNYDSIWEWAKRRGYNGSLDLCAQFIADATIEITFPPKVRERVEKVKRVRLSAATNAFTAPNLDAERRAVIDRLLVQWGLIGCP